MNRSGAASVAQAKVRARAAAEQRARDNAAAEAEHKEKSFWAQTKDWWESPVEYQWGKASASVFNLGYGAYMVYDGLGKMLVGAYAAIGGTAIFGIGAVPGIAIAAFGLYKVAFGGMRFARGWNRAADLIDDKARCSSRCTVGGQFCEGALGVLPRKTDSVLDMLGGVGF